MLSLHKVPQPYRNWTNTRVRQIYGRESLREWILLGETIEKERERRGELVAGERWIYCLFKSPTRKYLLVSNKWAEQAQRERAYQPVCVLWRYFTNYGLTLYKNFLLEKISTHFHDINVWPRNNHPNLETLVRLISEHFTTSFSTKKLIPQRIIIQEKRTCQGKFLLQTSISSFLQRWSLIIAEANNICYKRK